MAVTTFSEAKELLYGQPLDSFVAERDLLVKELRAAGERELATEIKALRKPSAVAAEVNRIVRDDPSGVELILQAAELLRAAQTGALDGSGINATELQKQYRAAIHALAQSAERRTAEVRAALEAATIDIDSNEDLRLGSLAVVPTPISIFDGPVPASPGPTRATPAAAPEDELSKRRALRRQPTEDSPATDQTPVKKPAAKKAEADKAAADKAKADKATADKATADKAAADKAKAAKAARKAAEAAKEEARRLKELEKERKRQHKELTKQHRDALRTHLGALDAEDAAVAAADAAEARIAEVDQQLGELEAAVADARLRRDAAMAESAAADQTKHEAGEATTVAETRVSELAEALAALD